MDWSIGSGLSADDSGFRDGLIDWLHENLTDEFRSANRIAGATDTSYYEVRLEWEKKLAAAKYLGITWPEELGGGGGTTVQQVIFLIEHGRSGAPYWAGLQGWDIFGPTLIAHGSEDLKRRFIPPITRCEQFWGQGYSEPGTGSDLAGLRTTATRDGAEWVINGQKTWTSFGQYAHWLFVLCRTEPAAPAHKSLSLILVPVDQPGVEVRPIAHMGGDVDFCEVFLDDARTDIDLVVGGVGNGWKVAMGSLGTERLTTTMPYQAGFPRYFEDVVAQLQRAGRTGDPVVRDALADTWIGLKINEWLNLRILTGMLRGAVPDAMSSLAKLRWATWHRSASARMIDLLGMQEIAQDPTDESDLLHQRHFLNARAETIYGGTNQIQRNIIGERVLGLPREPRYEEPWTPKP